MRTASQSTRRSIALSAWSSPAVIEALGDSARLAAISGIRKSLDSQSHAQAPGDRDSRRRNLPPEQVLVRLTTVTGVPRSPTIPVLIARRHASAEVSGA